MRALLVPDIRVLARARARCPIYSLLLPFGAGQLLAALAAQWLAATFSPDRLDYLPALLILAATLLVIVPARQRMCRTAALLALGAASMLPIPEGYRAAKGVETLVAVTLGISAAPQSPVPHGIVFDGQLLAAAEAAGARGPLPRAGRCRAPYLPWRSVHGLREGERRRAVIKLSPLRTPLTPFTFDNTLLRQGIEGYCSVLYLEDATPAHRPPLLDELRQHVATVVFSSTAERDPAALFLSMTLGTRHVVSNRVEEVFRRTGLAHLLVVSGYQVTVLGGLVLATLRIAGAGLFHRAAGRALFKAAPLLALVIVWCYALFTGGDGSTLRAAVTLTFLAAARQCERGDSFFQAVGVSLFALLLIWPGAFLEPGVQLTFAALFGIGLGLSMPAHSTAGKFLAVNLCTSLATAVPVLLWFHQFSLSGLLLNPLCASVLSFVSCSLGLPALLLAALCPLAAHVLLAPLIWSIWWCFLKLEWLSTLPAAFLTFDPPFHYVAALVPAGILLHLAGAQCRRSEQSLRRSSAE